MRGLQETQQQNTQQVGMCQSIASVLWPSFVVAGIANTLLFSFFDPSELMACRGGQGASLTAVYSMGFFSFWAITALSSFATQYFMKPCDENRRKS